MVTVWESVGLGVDQQSELAPSPLEYLRFASFLVLFSLSRAKTSPPLVAFAPDSLWQP